MGKQNHLSRLNSPKSWAIKKKGIKWVIKPSAGSHSPETSLPLGIVIRDVLLLSKTTRETKKILSDNHILINNIVRKDIKFPVGLMDTVAIHSLNNYYRVLLNKKGKIILAPIKKEDANLLYCKIINKTIISDKKVQLNLLYGKNILVDKDLYKVGDTLIISDKDELKKHLKLEKGSGIYLINGKHVGSTGSLEGIHRFEGSQPDKLIIKLGDKKIETLKDYAFVVDKPLL